MAQEIKEKKGDYTLKVGDYSCQLRKPNRSEYARVIGLVTPIAGQTPQILKAGEILLNSCWVSGDEEIKKDEQINVSACLQAVGLIDIVEAKLKKN